MYDTPDLKHGVFRLPVGDNTTLEWDVAGERLQIIRPDERAATLELGRAPQLRKQLNISGRSLARTVDELIKRRRATDCVTSDGESEPWDEVLTLLAREMIRLSAPKSQVHRAGDRLAAWLAPSATGPYSAWLARYNALVDACPDCEPLRGRYQLLQVAWEELLNLAQSEPRGRERAGARNLWWTAYCMYNQATEARTESPVDFRRATEAYLNLLMDRTQQDAKAAFFQEMGSSLENEVDRVMWGESGRGRKYELNPVLAQQPVVGRVHAWLLQRYRLLAAWRLTLAARGSLGIRLGKWRVILLILLVVLWGVSMTVFVLSNLAIWSLWSPTGRVAAMEWFQGETVYVTSALALFFVAISQLATVGTVSILMPHIFRLFLPRAWFGSLLAWISIIPALASPLASVKIPFGRSRAQPLGEYLLSSGQSIHPWWIVGLMVMPGFLLTMVLLLQEVKSNVEYSHRYLIGRSFLVASVALLGALYWGILAACGVAYVELTNASPPSMLSLLAVVLVGASLALPFGMVVQIIWQDKFITDPMFRES